MSLIPSHSTLVTTFTLMPSPLSFLLLFSPYSPYMWNKSRTSPCSKDVPDWRWWCRDGGAGMAAPISVSWRRTLALVLPRACSVAVAPPRCAPLSPARIPAWHSLPLLCHRTGLSLQFLNFSKTSHLACLSACCASLAAQSCWAGRQESGRRV